MAKKRIVNPANSISLAESFLEITDQSSKSVAKELPEGDSKPSSVITDYSWERFAFVCDKTLVAKVKAIATNEGLTIRELMEYMMTQGIARYEKKNGSIKTDVKVSAKKRPKDIM